MKTLNAINSEINKLRKERDELLQAEHGHMVGKCFHVLGLWVRVTGIEKSDFVTLEVDTEGEAIMVRRREFTNAVFVAGTEITEAEFDKAFDLMATKLKGGKK